MTTRKDLINEFENIIKTLIDREVLKGNPVRNIKYMSKKRLIEGINIFKKKLKPYQTDKERIEYLINQYKTKIDFLNNEVFKLGLELKQINKEVLK
jgi:hypothetical protein